MRWLPIPGYEGRYEVSDQGQVRSLVSHRGTPRRQPKILQPVLRRGYPTAHLSRGDGTTQKQAIHRLVLITFRGLPEPGLQGAHLNGNRNDARLANLAWVTAKENCSHRILHGTDYCGERSNTAKLTWPLVREIRLARKRGVLLRDLSQQYGVSISAIARIAAGKQWKE